MAADPNRFSKTTREMLAKRAGQICSNPMCRKPTSGPHTDDDKAVDVGEAAHIRGANPGSKRYDKAMIPAERRAITNGIWLCRTCAKLIDSDEKKYTVELLYDWKRNHEAERTLGIIGGSNLEKRLGDKFEPFRNESAAAQQIVLDKPEHWELLLALELLRPRLDQIKREYSDLRRGLIFKPFTVLDKSLFLGWMKKKGQELGNLAVLLRVAVEEEFNQSLGGPGEAGNALEIKRAVDKIIFGCQSLLDWEIDNEFTRFPGECEQIKRKTRDWTEPIVSELEKLPVGIAKLLDEPTPKGMYRINMALEFPENADEILSDMQKLSSQNHFRS
jgi:hypothetical protein